MYKITHSILKKLYQSPKSSHKGDNGILTIIAGSKKYHGAPLLAIKTASKIVDLVYFYSYSDNQEIVRKLKTESCCFINIEKKDLNKYIEKSDCILIGPGLDINNKNKKLINNLLKNFKDKKFVLDAGALRMLDKKNLHQNIVLTPHRQEFKELFGKKTVSQAANQYKCTIFLKGKKDIIGNSEKMYYNDTGNPAMTKGGTGDVLAGLIAALACKNDPLLAACAGAYINGTAGDKLSKQNSGYHNAEDLLNKITLNIK